MTDHVRCMEYPNKPYTLVAEECYNGMKHATPGLWKHTVYILRHTDRQIGVNTHIVVQQHHLVVLTSHL